MIRGYFEIIKFTKFMHKVLLQYRHLLATSLTQLEHFDVPSDKYQLIVVKSSDITSSLRHLLLDLSA